MNKRQVSFILTVTVTVIIILTSFVGVTVNSVNKKISEYCLNEITRSTKHLAADLHQSVSADRAVLSAMAETISYGDNVGSSSFRKIAQAYNTSFSFVSYMELLRPDNTLLAADGTVRNVSGILNFADEAKKGEYISGVVQGILKPDEKIVRNAVPVVKDGSTICVLYGVADLSVLIQKYKPDIFDENAYVYLVDGDTGDFILDTWHKSLGNVRNYLDNENLSGGTTQDVMEDMKNGIEGDRSFISRKNSQTMYMHYEPVGINNWSVAVTVADEYAMSESNVIHFRLSLMEIIIIGIVLVYMSCVWISVYKSYRQMKELGTEDQTTHLKNRNAFEEYVRTNRNKEYSEVVCIYSDVNGLHDINNRFGHAAGDILLRTVATELRREFDYKELYRVGGDEFVIICEETDAKICKTKIDNVVQQLKKQDYSISVGFIARKNEVGLDVIVKQADELMLKNKRIFYAESAAKKR